jgi:hypothetical protein
MDKINFLVLGLALFLCVCCTNEKTAELKAFSPDGGGFSIMLPGTPELQTQTVNTAAGPIVVKMYIVNDNGMAYIVSYNDYPQEAMDQTTPEQVLDGARDGAVANVYGKLLSETILSLDGYPGRQINVGVGDNGIKARIYLVNNRLYNVMVSGPGQKLTTKTVGDVLESFKLTK